MTKDEEYLRNLYEKINYDKQWLRIGVGENKYVFGMITADKVFSKLMMYRVIYETIADVNWKIKISFDEAIKYSMKESLSLEHFNPIKELCFEEQMARYYIENALFRLSTLWDMLAQLYNLFYDLDLEPNKIHYKNIFCKEENIDKYGENGDGIKIYIEQEDNTDCGDPWKGNHKYMTNLRNQMTHRNSPMLSSVSDFGMNFRDWPMYTLKRIIEDYATVSVFIKDILEKIYNQVLVEVEDDQNGKID